MPSKYNILSDADWECARNPGDGLVLRHAAEADQAREVGMMGKLMQHSLGQSLRDGAANSLHLDKREINKYHLITSPMVATLAYAEALGVHVEA